MAGKARPKRRGARPSSGLAWTLPLVAVVLAVIVLLAISRAHHPPPASGYPSKPAPADVVQNLARIPDATWARAGAGPALPPKLVPVAAGAPTVLYIGAEYCPFCAAERWPLAAALLRFGTFGGLRLIRSSPTDVYPNTPTLSFVGASYQSPVVQLQTVEYQSALNVPLQTPTAAQLELWRKYDAPPYVAQNEAGSIPFLLIGGRYLWVGTSYSPQLIQGRSWQAIASALPQGADPAAQAILANGNEIAAAICAVNGGQPSEVCRSAGVEAAARTLPQPEGQGATSSAPRSPRH